MYGSPATDCLQAVPPACGGQELSLVDSSAWLHVSCGGYVLRHRVGWGVCGFGGGAIDSKNLYTVNYRYEL